MRVILLFTFLFGGLGYFFGVISSQTTNIKEFNETSQYLFGGAVFFGFFIGVVLNKLSKP